MTAAGDRADGRLALPRRWLGWLFGPVDGAGFELFRGALTWTLLLYTLHRWQYVDEWLTAAGYHIPASASPSRVVFPLLPPEWVTPFGILYFGALAGLIFVGGGASGPRRAALSRVFTWVVLGCLFYVSHADRLGMFTLNKLYIGAYGILALAPRVDEAGGDDPRRLVLRSAWALRALQATLILQLFGAGMCKIRVGPWLESDVVLWYQIQDVFMTDTAAWMVRTLPHEAFVALQHGALGYELLAPALLMIPRLRPVAFVMAIGMFTLITATMHLLEFFTLQMACFYILFVDAGPLNRARRWARRRLG